MAFFDISRSAAPRSLGSVFARIAADAHAWYEARITRRALAKLSDRELNDIGLQRSDLDDLRGSFR